MAGAYCLWVLFLVLVGMIAIVVETGKEVEVVRGEPMDNAWGWYSQMWLTDKDGNMYHEDELAIIE